MTQSCTSGSVLLVQGLHACSALSQLQPGPLPLPAMALRWDGWQLLCQGSPSRLRCSLLQAVGRDTWTLL